MGLAFWGAGGQNNKDLEDERLQKELCSPCDVLTVLEAAPKLKLLHRHCQMHVPVLMKAIRRELVEE